MIGSCKVCPVLQSERDYLREQNAKLTEQIVRLERVREGLSEIPPQPRKPIPPMPKELRLMIDQAVESPAMRDDLERRANRAYKQHGSWEPVMQELTETLEGS